MKTCNQKNDKAKNPSYECNTKTGRWIKKKAVAGTKDCSPTSIRANDPSYECNPRTGRWIKKKNSAIAQKTIVILQSGHDPNKAFDNRDAGLFTILKQFPQFAIRHYIIHSYTDIKNAIAENPSITHLIIMAHGTQDGMNIMLNRNSKFGHKHRHFKEWIDNLRKRLTPRAPILLHSCSLGTGDKNFASIMSDVLPGHAIYAATAAISRGDLLITKFMTDRDDQIIVQYAIDDDKVMRQRREKYRMQRFYHDL